MKPEILRYLPLLSLISGGAIGFKLTDTAINNLKGVFYNNEYSEIETGVNETSAEGIMSIIAFLLPQLLILLTSPIVIPLTKGDGIIGLSTAGLITGLELGIGIRGLQGLIYVCLELIKSFKNS